MQAGPVTQLAAVLTDMGPQAPGVPSCQTRSPGRAGEAPSQKNAPPQEASPFRHDTADRCPREPETAGVPKTPARRSDEPTSHGAKRRSAADLRGNPRAARRGVRPVPPVMDAGIWTLAGKAALQEMQGQSATTTTVVGKQPPAADTKAGTTHPATGRLVRPTLARFAARRITAADTAAPKAAAPTRPVLSALPPALAAKRPLAGNAARRIPGAPNPTAKAEPAAPRQAAARGSVGAPAQPAPSIKKVVGTLISPTTAMPGKAAPQAAKSAHLAGAHGETGKPAPETGQVGHPVATDVTPAKGAKALDGAVAQDLSATVQAGKTQIVGQGLPAAVRDGAPVPVAARPIAPRTPTTQAATPVGPTLQTVGSSVRPSESAKGAPVLKEGGETHPQVGRVVPDAGRAVATFREATAAVTREPKTSRGKPSTATTAFSVQRVGSAVVVSRGRGQTPATVAADVPVSAAAAARSGPAPGRAGLAQMPPPPAPGNVADQVAESVRASGAPAGRQIVVQLQPPGLGRVRIVFRTEGDAVRGVVRVDNPETLSRLEREAAPLVQRLQASGIEVRRLDVMLSDSRDGDATQNPAFREGQQRPNGWVTDNRPGLPAGETFGDAGPPTGEPETQDPGALIGSGVINVRI